MLHVTWSGHQTDALLLIGRRRARGLRLAIGHGLAAILADDVFRRHLLHPDQIRIDAVAGVCEQLVERRIIGKKLHILEPLDPDVGVRRQFHDDARSVLQIP